MNKIFIASIIAISAMIAGCSSAPKEKPQVAAQPTVTVVVVPSQPAPAPAPVIVHQAPPQVVYQPTAPAPVVYQSAPSVIYESPAPVVYGQPRVHYQRGVNIYQPAPVEVRYAPRMY
jgi:hypothetical protein